MYKKLDLPNYSFKTRLDDFFFTRTKYKIFYGAIESDYKRQNLNYNTSKCDLNVITPLDIGSYCSVKDSVDDRITTLHNLYLSKNSYFSDILNDMRDEHKLLSCPSCGEDGSPNTLDHYLPKAVYPELSVCIYNLIPMCSKCQNEKSTEYKDINNNKLFFHPYYDTYLGDMYILEILPSPTYKTPVISIKVRNSLPPNLKKLALSQFNELNLSTRFSDFVTQTYRTAVDNLLSTNSDVNELLQIFINMHIKKGINNWNVILYKSMLENNIFVNWIKNERAK